MPVVFENCLLIYLLSFCLLEVPINSKRTVPCQHVFTGGFTEVVSLII